MTEGIIQEVFKAYHVDTHNYEYKATVNDINNLMARIQYELIQKIKREFQYCKPLLSLDKYTTLQKRLIGDNND